jgi:hypothetical protein
MAGFFSGTGSNTELGRVWQAISNVGRGSASAALRAQCGNYYGLGASTVALSSSFAGRLYPYTY